MKVSNRARRIAHRIVAQTRIAGDIMRDLIQEMYRRVSLGKQKTIDNTLPPENPMSFLGTLDELDIEDIDPKDLREHMTLEKAYNDATPVPLNKIQKKTLDAYIKGQKRKGLTPKEWQYWDAVAMGTHPQFPYNQLWEP